MKNGFHKPMIEDLAEVCDILAAMMTDGQEVQIREICFPAALCRLARHFDTTPWDLIAAAQEIRESAEKKKKTAKSKKRPRHLK